MTSFYMNGFLWRIRFVNPKSRKLVDRTNVVRVATTDPKTMTIYLSNRLTGAFLTRVLVHELGHCAIFSFGLADEIHKMTYPKYWVDAEEWVCNFIADYGLQIFESAYAFLGNSIWQYIPSRIENMLYMT